VSDKVALTKALTFTARPLPVKAWQWDGTPAGARAMAFPGVTIERLSKSRGLIVVANDREWLCLDPRDWLVKGYDGVIFVENDTAFRRQYQQQEEAACLP
jgi:hypothetical protein